MQRTSLRWGFGMGAIGAVIGVASLLLGLILGPGRQHTVDAAQLVAVFFVSAMVRLLFLAVVVGLAYFVGFRIEQMRAALPTGQSDQASDNRREAILAGGLVLLCDWLVQTFFIYATRLWGDHGPFLSFLGSQLVFGVICVLFGAGVAGLGARDAAARRVLARLTPTSAVIAESSAQPAAAGSETAPTE